MDCPWNSFKPSEIDFCEENLCSWVQEPASSYSCVLYVLIGMAILYKNSGSHSHTFGILLILIGVFSFIYHSSLTFVGSMLDLSAMYLLATVLLFVNLTRYNNFRMLQNRFCQWSFFILSNAFLLVYTLYFESTTGILYLGLILLVLAMELSHFVRGVRVRNYRFIFTAFLAYIGGSVFWYIDSYRVICYPENHLINGHVIWHGASAWAIFNVYKHYDPKNSSGNESAS